MARIRLRFEKKKFTSSSSFWILAVFVFISSSSQYLFAEKQIKPTSKNIMQSEKKMEQLSFEDILKNYIFIADFSPKEEERDIKADELFWKYPYKIKKTYFNLDINEEEIKKQILPTPGDGIAFEHINRGRFSFLEGNYLEAKNIWLHGGKRCSRNFPYKRRLEFYTGMAFLMLGKRALDEKRGGWKEGDAGGELLNAGGFLSGAMIRSADITDEAIEKFTPQTLYNLAVLYHRQDRNDLTFGSATYGLEYLRKVGRSDYRTMFHRFIAESYIENESYLEAFQQIDQALRQDPNQKTAADLFARAGDIYYDLNNYELADEAYAIANRLDQDNIKVHPDRFLRRGEILFWLNRHDESLENFYYGKQAMSRLENESIPNREEVAYADLRVADIYLHQKNFEKAKIAYFKVLQEHRGTEASDFASIRSTCLELPDYEGHNINHGREKLQKVIKEDGTSRLHELAFACYVRSFTQREITKAMLERVKSFANNYPHSKYLAEYREPVRQLQATKINEYFKRKTPYMALSFFEKNRKTLFPKISKELGSKLFFAYVESSNSEKAIEFYKNIDLKNISRGRDILYLATFYVETLNKKDWNVAMKQLNQKIISDKIEIKNNQGNQFLIRRILETKKFQPYLSWLMQFYEQRQDKNLDIFCGNYFNLSKEIFDTKNRNYVDPKLLSGTKESLSKKINENFKEINQTDPSCLNSFLELEYAVNKNKPDRLMDIYKKREEWPLEGFWLSLNWDLSELLRAENKVEPAKVLSNRIIDKAPKDSREYKLVKSRLDEVETESQNL